MKYPIPKHFEYFLFEKKDLNYLNLKKIPPKKFSRTQKNPYIENYISYINKF